MGVAKVTQVCPLCGKPASVTVDAQTYQRYLRDEGNVQDLFPDMAPADREILVSGTHDACWQEAFGVEV